MCHVYTWHIRLPGQAGQYVWAHARGPGLGVRGRAILAGEDHSARAGRGTAGAPAAPAARAWTTATAAASSSGVGLPRTTLIMESAAFLRVPTGAYRGMFPCFFGGSDSRFVRNCRSPFTTCARVSDGMTTAST